MEKVGTTESSRLPGARGSNQSGLRAYNERLLLSLLRHRGPMAKADIARDIGLSAQTVSNIMRALENDGMICKCPPVRGKVGQPSVPMRLAARGAFFLGLKIGRRSAELVLTDFLGDVQNRVHMTYRYPDTAATLRFARDAAGQLLDQLSADERQRVGGFGIAMPFQLWDWPKTIGVDESLMAAWRDFDIIGQMSADFEFPIFLENDASAACNAELVFGDKDGGDAFLYFYVGYFIGGGLVLNRRLFAGPTGNAAALGSMPICSNGRIRQLIEVASLAQLEFMLERQHVRTEGLWQSPHSWTFGSDVLDAWVDQAAPGLAFAAISATAVVEVSEIRIDGWIPLSLRKKLVSRVEEEVAKLDLAGLTRPAVREGSIGPDARVIGAASLPLTRRFLLDENSAL